MRTRYLLAALGLLANVWTRAEGQTRDRPTLVFTISGAYIDGVGLWSVPDQPITDQSAGGVGLTDHFALSRSISSTFGAAFSGTYYKGAHLGITGEGLLLGLGYDDTCQLAPPVQSSLNAERCASIPHQDHSAAAVAVSGGVIYRLAPEEFISPFFRAGAGVVFNNQSSILMVGQSADGVELTIYDDSTQGTSIKPAFGLGAGTSIALSKAYHLRFEIRDNILGIDAVTGATPDRGFEPPHETVYKNLFSLIVGLDVVLERRPGRRY